LGLAKAEEKMVILKEVQTVGFGNKKDKWAAGGITKKKKRTIRQKSLGGT